jgi:hypothetical protein
VPLGVQLFTRHLEQLKEDGANIVPMVNQIEGSVTLQNPHRQILLDNNILPKPSRHLTRPFRNARTGPPNWLTAKTPDKSRSLPLQLGYAVTYLTNFEKRMVSNAQVFDFELSDDEMSQLTALNRPDGGWGLPNPNDLKSRSSSPGSLTLRTNKITR